MGVIRTGIYVLIHPMIGFRIIKEEKEKQTYLTVCLISLIIISLRIIQIYFIHFPYEGISPRDTNLFYEAAKLLLPIMTWSVACYGLTTIMDGKTTLKEQILASFYAMTPYLVLQGPIILASHLMGLSNQGLYYYMNTAMWLWVIVLFLLSTLTMNEYSVKKALGIAVLSIITSLLIWILIGLFYTIGQQVIDTIRTIIIEYSVLNS